MLDLDPMLSKTFAQARAPLADDRFTATLLAKIDRTRRARLRQRVLLLSLAALVVLANVPLLEKTATLLGSVGNFFSVRAQFLITPWGWAVSMIVGVCILIRTRPSRR
jgi:hypothetical protein